MFSAEAAACPSEGLPRPGPGAGQQQRVPAIMFEFRNDVCVQPEWRAKALKAVLDVLHMQGLLRGEERRSQGRAS